MRWNIFRSLLMLSLVAGGVAIAGWGRSKPTPPPPAQAPEPQPEPAPPAPALFPDGLPVAVQEIPEGLANLSDQGCNACHGHVHDAWAESAHHAAGTNAQFREAIERAGETTACTACHMPLANQHAQLATGYLDGDLSRPQLERNPLWEATLTGEGVTCVACHVRQGTVLSTHAAPDAPHPVTVSEELTSPQLCATCHQLTWPGADTPLYDTYGEWQASAYAKAGVTCQDCHMPPRAGTVSGSHFAASADHRFRADPARAVSILIDLDEPEFQRGEDTPVRVRIQNTGAGHHVPTGSPFKRWQVQIVLIGADGQPLCEPETQDYGRTLEDAPPWKTLEDNRIPAGGEVTLERSLQVSQRKHAQQATLQISVHQVVEGKVGPAMITRSLPVALR